MFNEGIIWYLTLLVLSVYLNLDNWQYICAIQTVISNLHKGSCAPNYFHFSRVDIVTSMVAWNWCTLAGKIDNMHCSNTVIICLNKVLTNTSSQSFCIPSIHPYQSCCIPSLMLTLRASLLENENYLAYKSLCDFVTVVIS